MQSIEKVKKAKVYRKVTIGKRKPKTQPFAERKLAKLKKRCRNRQSLIDYVLQIEDHWERYALERTDSTLEQLLRALKYKIRNTAQFWGNQWRNKGLCAADFESIFFEEAYRLAQEYTHYNDFYFYETLYRNMRSRAIDFVRHETRTKQGAFERSVVPLREGAQNFLSNGYDMESDVINRLLVAQILNDSDLTAQERAVLCALYNEPSASHRKIAAALNIHHEQVRRILKSVNKKLANYHC